MILETDRLLLREMNPEDLPALCRVLQDEAAMYAYERAFSLEEVNAWLKRQLERYEQHGFGLWAVLLRNTGEVIGQCGLSVQDCGGREVLEVGYLFERKFWHHGYATEAARACRNYAFDVLGAEEVFSIIRDTNSASQGVARRNGMALRGSFVKHAYGADMLHLIFSVKKEELHKPSAEAQEGPVPIKTENSN